MNLGEWANNISRADVAIIQEWIKDLQKLGDFGKAVQLNFIEERRIPKPLMKRFLNSLAKEYKRIKVKNNNSDAATVAIENVVKSDNKFFGALHALTAKSYSYEIKHFKSLQTLNRRGYTDEPVDPNDPQPYVSITRGLGMGKGGENIHLYIWVTFPYDDKDFDDMDATSIRDALGLSRVKEDDYLYKFDIAATPRDKLRIPSVFDAKGNPPWFPAPAESPWGITRNLNTNAEEFPELLREALPSKELSPRGQLIRDKQGNASRTSAPSDDYLRHRMYSYGEIT